MCQAGNTLWTNRIGSSLLKPLSLFLNSKWHFKIESAAQSSGIRHGFWSQSCSWWSKLKGFVQVEKFRTCLTVSSQSRILRNNKVPSLCTYTLKARQLLSAWTQTNWNTFGNVWVIWNDQTSRTNLDLRRSASMRPAKVSKSGLLLPGPLQREHHLRLPGNLYRITRYYEWVVWPVREF